MLTKLTWGWVTASFPVPAFAAVTESVLPWLHLSKAQPLWKMTKSSSVTVLRAGGGGEYNRKSMLRARL